MRYFWFEPHTRESWRDWERVEACLYAGLKRWGLTMLALWLSDQQVKPVSVEASGVLDIVILLAHFAIVKRVDAHMAAMIDE